MITGFVDESGTPSSGNDETGVYTVALLLTHDLKSLDVTVRRLRRALGRRNRSKYANKDPWAAQIIADLVVSEETVRGIKIAALPGGR